MCIADGIYKSIYNVSQCGISRSNHVIILVTIKDNSPLVAFYNRSGKLNAGVGEVYTVGVLRTCYRPRRLHILGHPIHPDTVFVLDFQGSARRGDGKAGWQLTCQALGHLHEGVALLGRVRVIHPVYCQGPDIIDRSGTCKLDVGIQVVITGIDVCIFIGCCIGMKHVVGHIKLIDILATVAGPHDLGVWRDKIHLSAVDLVPDLGVVECIPV